VKILAPLKNSAEVMPLLQAGADEFYCGLTPPDWQQHCGQSWANRRGAVSAGIRDLADFQLAVAAAAEHPVYVALNAPWYPPGGVELLAEFGAQLLATGAAALIVADMDLLLTLTAAGYAEKLHVSSLATCTNPAAAAFFRDLGVARVILPRHLTLAEIAAVGVDKLELEAFLLNDGCVFEEGLCATTHAAGTFCLEDGADTTDLATETTERYAFWKWTLNHCGCQTSQGYPLGPCGLCALPRLLASGIHSFKVVGREASLPRKEKAVEIAARALRIARSGGGPWEIRQAVMNLRGADSLCEGSHLCYYPDVWRQICPEEPRC